MKKTLLLVSLILVIGLGALALLRSSVPPPPVEVRINSTYDMPSSLLWVAESAGYFKEENLKVDLRVFTAGKLGLANMLSDPQVDYTVVYGTPIVKQIIQGKELRALTGLHTSNKNTGIVFKGPRPANLREGILGKRIGLQMGTNAEFAVNELLRQHGLRTRDVTLVNLPAMDLPRKIITGELDAAMVWRPILTDVITALEDNKIAHWEPELEYYREFSFLVTDDVRAERNAEVSIRLLRAMHRAYALYKKDPTQFATMPVPADVATKYPNGLAQELKYFDLIFGLSNQMAQSLELELKYFCLVADTCDATTLLRMDQLMWPQAMEQVAPNLVKLKTWK